MHKLTKAQTIIRDARKYRKTEKAIYDQFIASARKHRMSINIGNSILYVEDDSSSVSVFKALIEATCSDAECERLKVKPIPGMAAAKEFIENNFIALKCVILDINLHDGDGGALLDWIMHKYDQTLSVIVYSGDLTRVKAIREKYPKLEVLLKGHGSSDALVNAVVLNSTCKADLRSSCKKRTCTTCDNNVEE